MNQQDQQAIDELFQHLYESAGKTGSRDPEAEARIQQKFQQGPPGLLYHMAQTLVAQQYSLQQARAELADCQRQQQQSGRPAGFARPAWGQGAAQPGYGGYGPPPYQQGYGPSGWRQPGGGGFLAGAGQIALGVGGGILAAEALSNIFSGGGGLFGDRDDRDYDDRDYDDRGDDDRGDRDDRQDYDDRDYGQDYGGQDDYTGQDLADGGYDGGFDGGGFDGGGFDGGDQGGW